jgi:hypothetical protein
MFPSDAGRREDSIAESVTRVVRLAGMALLHQAEVRPSKLELLSGWAPLQPWFTGDAGAELTSGGAYRFDDPEGEVGVETLMVRAGDGLAMQVPLTYRGVPLADGDEWLIGTLQHSVLGTRWVYDGAGDPVYRLAVATAVITGGGQAELYVDIDGERVRREPTAKVIGSGIAGAPVPSLPAIEDLSVHSAEEVTVVDIPGMRITIPRILGGSQHSSDPAVGVLSGTWTGQDDPQPLVFVELR